VPNLTSGLHIVFPSPPRSAGQAVRDQPLGRLQEFFLRRFAPVVVPFLVHNIVFFGFSRSSSCHICYTKKNVFGASRYSKCRAIPRRLAPFDVPFSVPIKSFIGSAPLIAPNSSTSGWAKLGQHALPALHGRSEVRVRFAVTLLISGFAICSICRLCCA